MKKIILLFILFFIPFIVFALPEGDVDGNGKTEVADYVLVRKHLLKQITLTGARKARADVDGKGGITAGDYIVIRKIIMGIISTTNTPSPTTSTKPTATQAPTPTPPPSSTYDITQDTAKLSGFKVLKEYSSSTLRYKVLTRSGESKKYYTVIWVADANKQINSAIPSSRQKMDNIMNNEIKAYGLGSKGILAINASFMWNNKPGTPIVMSHGKVAYDNGYSLPNYHNIGIDKNGNITYRLRNDTTLSDLQSKGIRNTWAGNYCDEINSKETGGRIDWWNEFGQIDSHNFAIYTGYEKLETAQGLLYYYFGITRACNMDGGGSVRLYYKYGNSSKISSIFKSPTDSNRTLSDALYFVEQ